MCERVYVRVCVLNPRQRLLLLLNVITKVCSGVVPDIFECMQLTARISLIS